MRFTIGHRGFFLPMRDFIRYYNYIRTLDALHIVYKILIFDRHVV